MDMYYSNNFYVEYTRDYNDLTTKIRHIVSKTMTDVLFFDKGFWDLNKFSLSRINVIKNLPTAYFKTLQMSFYTKSSGQEFCIKNIEFGKIKVKA